MAFVDQRFENRYYVSFNGSYEPMFDFASTVTRVSEIGVVSVSSRALLRISPQTGLMTGRRPEAMQPCKQVAISRMGPGAFMNTPSSVSTDYMTALCRCQLPSTAPFHLIRGKQGLRTTSIQIDSTACLNVSMASMWSWGETTPTRIGYLI